MVSVLVISWNHEKYIEQCLRSIIAQTYSDIEIIYADNNSADKTFEIAENILQRSPVKYKVLKREKNYYASANLNFLLEQSCGDFISMISGDDWLYISNIEEKLKPFNNDKDLGMVDSIGYKFYEDINIYEPIKFQQVKKENVLNELLQRNFLSGLGCVIKREVFESIGSWDESSPVEDWDMWIRIATKFNIMKLDKPLFFYRQHAYAISKNFEFMYSSKMQTYKKFNHLNNYKEQTKRNIWETYIAARVTYKASPVAALEILKRFRFTKLYLALLIKSLLPFSLKKWYFNRSLKRKYKNINPLSQDK